MEKFFLGVVATIITLIVISGLVTHNYNNLLARAEEKTLTLVEIPNVSSMSVLDDNGYLEVDRSQVFSETARHTYSISGYGIDARTGVGCYEAWPFDGRVDSEGYGEAFCISESDMEYLFRHGAKYK